jgi:Cu2+-exporting ATPase
MPSRLTLVACTHCGQPAPPSPTDGPAFCCDGCRTAHAILNGAPVPDVAPPPFPYDDADFLASLDGGDGPDYALTFRLDGLHCPSCIRVIELILARAGIAEARVHLTAKKISLRWSQTAIPLSRIAAILAGAGYTLVPVLDSEAAILRRQSRRGWALRLAVTCFAAVSVGFLGEALTWGTFAADDHTSWLLLGWMSALVATPTLAYAGLPFFHGAWQGLKHRVLGMDLTIALGALATWVASMVTLLRGHGAFYFDSLTMFLFLIVVGRWGESWAQEKAAAAADSLLPPPLGTATVWTGEGWEQRPPQRIRTGDRVRIAAGDTCPVDGRIVAGRAEIDESILTGESRPLVRTPGESLRGGSLVVDGHLELIAERVGAATTMSRIRRLAEQASSAQSPWSHLTERVAHVMVLLILAAAAVTLWIWRAEPEQALLHAVAVLIISCPCALGLATPAALTLAAAKAWRLGLLVKDGLALDALGRLTHLVLDKTGTVTRHALTLTQVLPRDDEDEASVLAVAAAVTATSHHPAAKPIAAAARDRLPTTGDWQSVPGCGVVATVDGALAQVGRASWLAEAGIRLPETLLAQAELAASTGHTVSWVAHGGRCLGAIVLAADVRPDAWTTISRLRRLGVTVTLLSGDSQAATTAMAERIGADGGKGGVLPEDKLSTISDLQGPDRIIGMVGDGVNDGPALAAADVGIAIGEGTGLAIESAPVVLLGERLAPLADGVALARRTTRIIRENLALSALYNLIAVPLAMAGWVTPALAAVLMPLSSILVVVNAMRLQASDKNLQAAPAGKE